jgi:hypothetical protein
VHDAVLVEGTFALLRLLGEDVSFKRFLVGDLPRAGHFKPFFCARVRFNLGHYCLFYFYTLLAFRTGGNLWSLVGNPAIAGNGRQSYDKKLKIAYDLVNFQLIPLFCQHYEILSPACSGFRIPFIFSL